MCRTAKWTFRGLCFTRNLPVGIYRVDNETEDFEKQKEGSRAFLTVPRLLAAIFFDWLLFKVPSNNSKAVVTTAVFQPYSASGQIRPHHTERKG
jgi:hypothetical protein